MVALYCACFVHFCVKTVYFIAVNLATFKAVLLTRNIKVPSSDLWNVWEHPRLTSLSRLPLPQYPSLRTLGMAELGEELLYGELSCRSPFLARLVQGRPPPRAFVTAGASEHEEGRDRRALVLLCCKWRLGLDPCSPRRDKDPGTQSAQRITENPNHLALNGSGSVCTSSWCGSILQPRSLAPGFPSTMKNLRSLHLSHAAVRSYLPEQSALKMQHWVVFFKVASLLQSSPSALNSSSELSYWSAK